MSKVQSQVDRLGYLKAQIADLEKEAKALQAEVLEALVATGESAADGALFRAVLVQSEGKSVDWKAIAQKLEPSRQLVQAYTKPVFKQFVKINARKKEAA